MSAASRIEQIETPEGVRLKCFRTCQTYDNAPVAVLIHGWLGGAQSIYMLSASDELYKAGFEVWRLQMRDHGDTHDLNEGIFHSCLIDEAVSAIGVIQKMIGGRELSLGGFSLGANFALRIAARASAAHLDLAQVVAICPVLHPPSTLDALETGPRAYNYYFMRKWRRALRLKHRSWPETYDIDEIEKHQTMRDLTRHLVTEYSHYADLITYLNGYSILGKALESIKVPSLLVVAKDDPIIPIKDLARVATPEKLKIHVTEHGGHVGYLYSPTGPTWADDVLVRRFLAANRARHAATQEFSRTGSN